MPKLKLPNEEIIHWLIKNHSSSGIVKILSIFYHYKMKKILAIFLLSLLIVSCGPPKKEIAQAACSEILATRNFEDSTRVQIYNKARMDLDMSPISSSDDKTFFDIKIRYGGYDGCMELFFPPPPPTKKELEQQRIAEEELRIIRENQEKKRAEERAIKEEELRIIRENEEKKRAEERAIKEEERRIAEEKRIAEERKKLEEARLAQEKKLREEEERRIYVKENTVTSYLYCPSNSKISRRSEVPSYWKGLIINKLDDDYLNSSIYRSSSQVETAILTSFYKSDHEFGVMRSCQDLIDYSYAYNEQYPSDELIYKFEQKAIKDAENENTKPNYIDWDLRKLGLTYDQERYLEYRRMLKGAPSNLNVSISSFKQKDVLLNGIEPLFCEKVGTEIYVLDYLRVKPEIKKNIIIRKSQGNVILDSIDLDESVLMTGSGRTFNRDKFSTSEYDSCEIINEDEFNLKVIKPLEDKFKATIENQKLFLENSKKDVERQI